MRWKRPSMQQVSGGLRILVSAHLLALAAGSLSGAMPSSDRDKAGAAPSSGLTASAAESKLFLPLVPKRHSHRDALRRLALPNVGPCTAERYVWSGDPDADLNDADVDGQGNLWLATSIGAVGRMVDGGWLHAAKIDGMADDDTTRVAIDSQGQPWFGTQDRSQDSFAGRWSFWWSGGLTCLVDPQANRLYFGTRTWRNTGDAASGVLGPVGDLAADPRDGIWLATGTAFQDQTRLAGGIYHLSGAGQWTFIADPAGRTASAQGLAFDAENSLWFEGDAGIVVRRSDGSWPSSLEGGRRLDRYSEMAVSEGGEAVWLFDQGGRMLSRLRGDSWLDVTLPSELSLAPHTMAVDPPGNVWLASETYAAVRWKEGAWQVFPRSEGLGAGYIERIWRDRIGDIWVNQWSDALGEGLTRLRCR